jgi:hypothetical protein
MGSTLDLLGSLILLGVLILAVATVHLNMNQSVNEGGFELRTQQNLIELARTMEFDFLKIGYNSPKPAIAVADSDRITFKADLENRGIIDSVRYYLGGPSDGGVAATPNPRDRVLYRVLNNEPQRGTSLGVVQFYLTYYDSAGNTTTAPNMIRSIRVQLTVESQYPVDSTFAGAYWEKHIYPRNL